MVTGRENRFLKGETGRHRKQAIVIDDTTHKPTGCEGVGKESWEWP